MTEQQVKDAYTAWGLQGAINIAKERGWSLEQIVAFVAQMQKGESV